MVYSCGMDEATKTPSRATLKPIAWETRDYPGSDWTRRYAETIGAFYTVWVRTGYGGYVEIQRRTVIARGNEFINVTTLEEGLAKAFEDYQNTIMGLFQ